MRALLFNGNCITCHNIKETISAPSVIRFKARYLTAFEKKEDFVNYMSKWVTKPNRKTSIMVDAIVNHGLMPELGYDRSVIKEIAGYIYDTDFKYY